MCINYITLCYNINISRFNKNNNGYIIFRFIIHFKTKSDTVQTFIKSNCHQEGSISSL